jgi:radical SAM superfamily enzyme YgiQ (UPF0313 family)
MSTWKQSEAARAILARETGTIRKDQGGRLCVALAYPNSYHVGMSSLALQILYHSLNSDPKVVCERVFWDHRLNAPGLPLLSLESQTPVRQFDVWAFTISFEMDYFNVLAMLRAAGVPPLAEERSRLDAGSGIPDRYPLLIGGGPGIAMNPEPMAPFFDAIVIGEAEEILPCLVETLRNGISDEREGLLDALDLLPGVYVPTRVAPTPHGRRIERLWVRDMGLIEPVSCLYTPDTEFGNRHLIEIARGCGRGCHFCLAGYVYRPPREQPLERILAWAREGVGRASRDRGRAEGIGLVSAAVSDHSQIDSLATELQALGIRISVSSMRTDPISLPLVRALAGSGTKTLTIAPEAGSPRLRKVINKTQTEDDLLSAVELAQVLSFPHLKLYFMVGHPTETDEDVQGIADLTLKARALFRRNISINATPFVPKPHTPFQWAAMTPAKTLSERQKRLRQALARHQVTVHADPPDWAEVQAVLARGDRRLAPALLDLDRLSPRSFREVLARHGMAMEELLSERDPATFMPWEIVDTGLRTNYLRREDRLAMEANTGHRCPPGASGTSAVSAPIHMVEGQAGRSDEPGESTDSHAVCLACGVCDLAYWRGIVAADPVQVDSGPGGTSTPQSELGNTQSYASS